MSVRGALGVGAKLTGADAVAAAVVRPLRTTALLGRSALESVRLLLRPDGTGGVGISSGAADERAALLAATWQRWVWWWLASVLVVAWGIALGRAYASVYGPLGCLLPLALLPLTASMAMRQAHAHWCLRRGRVGRVGEWLRQPGEWLPPSDHRLGGVGLLAAAVLLLGAPASVQAAAATTGAAGTLAQQIIDALLPPGGGVTGLTAALGVVTHVTMFCGAGMLAWSSLATTVAAAEAGRVLAASGGGSVGAWGPIRVVLGLVLLAPVPSGLPLVASALVRPGAVASDYLAAQAWSTFVDKLTDATPVAPPGLPPSVGGDVLAQQVLRSASCVALRANLAAASEAVTTGASAATDSPSSGPAPGGTWVRTGSDADDSGLHVWSWGACGAVSVSTPATAAGDAARAYSTARIAAVDALVQSVTDGGLPAEVAAAAMPGGTGPGMPQDVLARLGAAAAAYDKAVVAASVTMTAAQTATVRAKLRSRSDDWLNAGAYYRALAQLQARGVALATQASSWQPPATTEAARALGASDDTIRAVQASGDALAAEIVRERGAASVTAVDLAAIGDGDGDTMLQQLVGPIDKRIAAALVASDSDSTDPMADISNSGALLLSAGEAGVVGGIPVAMAAGTAPAKLVGMDKVLDWLSPKANAVIGAAMAAGWVQQYLLPTTPWIATLWLAVGWIISIVEVMIFSVLWALLLVRLDGREFLEHVHKPGLVIGVNFVFRPVLGVLGLIAAYYVLPLAFRLTNNFSDAYVGQQGGHFVGVAGVLGGILLLDYLRYQLCTRVLALVHTVPDRLPSWVGMHASGFGGAQEGHDKSVGGAVAITGGAGRAAGGPGGGGGGPGGRGPGLPSRLPSGGGGEVGVRPVGGDSGVPGTGGGAGHWSRASGGLDGLDEGQRSAATAAHADWQARTGHTHSLADYVGHAQAREAQRGQG